MPWDVFLPVSAFPLPILLWVRLSQSGVVVSGLGVYMIRVKKAFAFDKMFAVIFLISIISLLLMKLVDILQKKCMPWEKAK